MIDVDKLASDIALKMSGSVDFEDIVSCKIYWDWYSVIKTPLEKEEVQKRIKVAKELKQQGTDQASISIDVNLPLVVIETL